MFHGGNTISITRFDIAVAIIEISKVTLRGKTLRTIIVHRRSAIVRTAILFFDKVIVWIFIWSRVVWIILRVYSCVILTSESNEPVFCASRVLVAREPHRYKLHGSPWPRVFPVTRKALACLGSLPFVRDNQHCITRRHSKNFWSVDALKVFIFLHIKYSTLFDSQLACSKHARKLSTIQRWILKYIWSF